MQRSPTLCVCVCVLETLFVSNVRGAFETGTPFLGKDVVLIDGRLIFVS